MKKALLLATLAVALSPAAFSQHMFRGDLAHTGIYKSEGPRRFEAVKWMFKTEGWVLSSPTLAGGVLYIGSDDGKLYAIDVKNGSEKWRFTAGGPVRSSAAIVDGLVYFGSYDGFFYAVEAASGKLRWKFEHGERQFEAKHLHGGLPANQTAPDFWDFFQSSPAVDKGIVYFGSGDGHLYALDAQSGLLKWKFATKDVVHSSPAIADGTVYFGSWDSYLYAVDAASGQEKWKFKTGEDNVYHNQVGIQSSPAVADGVVYFGCRDASLYAVNAKTGQQRWRFNNRGSWINTSPAIYDGAAYVGSPIPGIFRAIDIKTGEVKYKIDAKMLIFSSPAVAGGMAYFGSFNGKLYAVDLKTGQFVWEFQTASGKKDSLGITLPDGRPDRANIFRGRTYDAMYRGGEKLFSLGSILSSPAVDHGVIYFGSTDGNVYAIE